MLDKKVDEIITDDAGKFVGVRSGDETVKAKQVVSDARASSFDVCIINSRGCRSETHRTSWSSLPVALERSAYLRVPRSFVRSACLSTRSLVRRTLTVFRSSSHRTRLSVAMVSILMIVS